MLKAAEVLKEIHDEGALNVAHLARRFGTSPEAVRELVGSLQDQGYLEVVELGCLHSGCRRCPLQERCSQGIAGIRIYRLSGRGLRLIGKGGE